MRENPPSSGVFSRIKALSLLIFPRRHAIIAFERPVEAGAALVANHQRDIVDSASLFVLPRRHAIIAFERSVEAGATLVANHQRNIVDGELRILQEERGSLHSRA